MAIQRVVAIAGFSVAISWRKKIYQRFINLLDSVTLFVIEVGINVTIAIGLVPPCICLMAVTVISPEPMDINSRASSWSVHLNM